MVRWVIINRGLAGVPNPANPSVPDGAYLASYDPDENDGIGSIAWTTNLGRAMLFASADAALATYRMQSKTRPRRNDGKPNCPLMARTVECVEVVTSE